MMTNFAGLNENNKPSSKVLRPPGGGSSDIFGSDVSSTPRSVKNHMQSNIFSCEKGSVKNNGDQPRRAQKNVDSYTRLFGESDRPVTPAKNHMKSNIAFGGTAAAAAAAAASANGNGNDNSTTNGNGLHASNGRNGKLENGGSSSSASSVSSSTENLKMNGLSKTDGNPVTGEGYKPAGGEINTTIPSLNGANQVINKNRIPPGGFSSGLW